MLNIMFFKKFEFIIHIQLAEYQLNDRKDMKYNFVKTILI